MRSEECFEHEPMVPQSVEAYAVRAAWEKVHAENHVRDAI